MGRVTSPSNLMPTSQFNVNRSPSPPLHMMRQKFRFPKHPAFASKPFEELNISRNIALSWCNANSSSIVELDLNLIGLNLNWVQSIYFIIARGPSPPPHLMRQIYRPKALQKICHATQNLFKLQFHCLYNWHKQNVSGVGELHHHYDNHRDFDHHEDNHLKITRRNSTVLLGVRASRPIC